MVRKRLLVTLLWPRGPRFWFYHAGTGITMNRRYDLDWLRVIAFAILMLFHTGMAFSSYDWHVKNFESSALIDWLIMFFHQWRMPLLFFISGAAVWFAMEKYPTWRYLRERHTRLLVPLLFGMSVVIPPQVYCERLYQGQTYSSFLDFYPTIFTSGSYPQGNLSWHHLWYVPYIWAFSMITLPLFAWLRSTPGRTVLARLQRFLSRPSRYSPCSSPPQSSRYCSAPFIRATPTTWSPIGPTSLTSCRSLSSALSSPPPLGLGHPRRPPAQVSPGRSPFADGAPRLVLTAVPALGRPPAFAACRTSIPGCGCWPPWALAGSI